jgi:hypothetical protein
MVPGGFIAIRASHHQKNPACMHTGRPNDRPTAGNPRASEFFFSTSCNCFVQAHLRYQLLQTAVSSWMRRLVQFHPDVLLLPTIKVCSLIPTVRISSATGTPVSACFVTAAIYSTEIASSSWQIPQLSPGSVLSKANIAVGSKFPVLIDCFEAGWRLIVLGALSTIS